MQNHHHLLLLLQNHHHHHHHHQELTEINLANKSNVIGTTDNKQTIHPPLRPWWTSLNLPQKSLLCSGVPHAGRRSLHWFWKCSRSWRTWSRHGSRSRHTWSRHGSKSRSLHWSRHCSRTQSSPRLLIMLHISTEPDSSRSLYCYESGRLKWLVGRFNGVRPKTVAVIFSYNWTLVPMTMSRLSDLRKIQWQQGAWPLGQ